MKHHLEFNDGKSAKFWQVAVDGDTVTTQWGKIGATGQSKTKSYDSPEAAEKDALKQKNAKLKKGYEEASSDNSGIAKTATVAPAKKLQRPLQRNLYKKRLTLAQHQKQNLLPGVRPRGALALSLNKRSDGFPNQIEPLLAGRTVRHIFSQSSLTAVIKPREARLLVTPKLLETTSSV